jgi:hypothetical protein
MLSEFGPIWFDIVESYLYYLKYSLVMGSTGEQNGKEQLKYIQLYSQGWEIVQPCLNRRVTNKEDHLYLYWKVLQKPKIEIDWNKPTPHDANYASTS